MSPSIRPVVNAASLAILTAALLPAQTAAQALQVSVPFVSPKGEYVTQKDRYHSFRIPGMIVAPDGSVLVFAEARRGDGSDPRRNENAPIDLVMRRSTDNGRTWLPMVVIESGFRENGLVDFADPTPVLDATTGTIFLFYGQWPDIGPITVAHGQSPAPDSGNHVVWVRSSADNGQSWSDRTQVVYPDEPSETSDGLYWRQAEPGPGSGIQLQWQDAANSRNGRLLIPAKRSGSETPDGPATVEPFVYYSDDHGKTWQVGNVTQGPDANEDEVVELTDSRVLLDGRQNDGDFRRRHLSADGGVTWGPDRPDSIPLTKVDGSMARYSAKRSGHDRDRILFSAPRGEGGLNRNNLTIWTSFDEAETFVNPIQISTGFAAYSVIQRLADGTIGLLVETAKQPGVRYGEITFYRLDLSKLEPAAKPR